MSNKCAHDGCHCATPSGQQFCGDHCRKAGLEPSRTGSCACDHPECKGDHSAG